MKKFTSELYALDPTKRIDVTLFDNESPARQGKKLYNAVQNDLFMIRLQQIAWSFFRDKSAIKEPQKEISKLLSDTGLREVITNTAVRMYEKGYARRQRSEFATLSVCSKHSKDESIECIRQVRMEWEQGIHDELLVIAQEQDRPFAMMRAPGKFEKFLETGDSNILGNGGKGSVKFLFDSEDLLETAVNIRSANLKADYAGLSLGLVKLSLGTPSIEDLSVKFKELAAGYTQLGLDEKHIAGGIKFSHQRHEEGEALAACGTTTEVRKYMRRGVPPALRAKVWRAALGLPPEVALEERNRLKVLRSYCEHIDLITDRLYLYDVDNVVDDPRFFVFAEEIAEVVMAFTRDDWVRHNALYQVHLPVVSLIDPRVEGGGAAGDTVAAGGKEEAKGVSSAGAGASTAADGKEGIPSTSLAADPLQLPSSKRPSLKTKVSGAETRQAPKDATAPTSAVQPFLGLAIYTAPLCYIFGDRAALYSAHKVLWCRLWCRMNVISGDRGTLLSVCATFESLLMSSNPPLFLHLIKIGVQPLLIVMPWLQFGFVGLLEVDQILHLWDRVIGYDDPNILALLAVAIFMVRSEAIMACSMPAEVCSIIMEGTRLRVVPLLQMMLFRDSEKRA